MLIFDILLLVIKMKDCLFCKINNGDIPSKKLYENDYVFVIMDLHPVSNGHLLIIPKKHFTDFTELDNETLSHINETSKLMKDLIYKKLNAVGLKICVNYGIAQEIKHYHMHLIPVYKNKETIKDLEETYNMLTK